MHTVQDTRAELVASVLGGLRGLGREVQELVRRQLGTQLERKSDHPLDPPAGGVTSMASLAVLARLDTGGELRCSTLADLLGLDISVVSRQLAVLDHQGLITRRPDPDDGRAWLNAVNEAGDTILQRLRDEWLAPARDALSGWDEADLHALSTYLVRLEADLRRASDPAGRREVRP